MRTSRNLIVVVLAALLITGAFRPEHTGAIVGIGAILLLLSAALAALEYSRRDKAREKRV
jgi:positive regulator of sigma E activity